MKRLYLAMGMWLVMVSVVNGAGYTFEALTTDAVGDQVEGFRVQCFDSYSASATEHYDGSGSTAFGSASFYCLGLRGLAQIKTGEMSGSTCTVRFYSQVGTSGVSVKFVTINLGASSDYLLPLVESPEIERHAVSVQMDTGTGTVSISEIWKR